MSEIMTNFRAVDMLGGKKNVKKAAPKAAPKVVAPVAAPVVVEEVETPAVEAVSEVLSTEE